MRSLLVFFCLVAVPAWADIYTDPDPTATGGARGTVSFPITDALLISADLKNVFHVGVSGQGKSFAFTHVPVGKYSVVLVDDPPNGSSPGRIYSGLPATAGTGEVPPALFGKLDAQMKKNDPFYNRYQMDAFSFTEENVYAVSVIERIKDTDILNNALKVVNHYLRRIEVATVELATDDWKTNSTRHIYRSELPKDHPIAFLEYVAVPSLAKIRVVDSVKDLGEIELPMGSVKGR